MTETDMTTSKKNTVTKDICIHRLVHRKLSSVLLFKCDKHSS